MPYGQYIHKCTDIKIRFLRKVNKTDTCWIWMAYRNKAGYGMIGLSGGNKTVLSHRLSYELYRGTIPSGYYVCHTCDNPSCVNPEHLFVGTQKDNAQDSLKKGRWGGKRNFPKGESSPHAKFTNEQIKEIRSRYVRGVFGIPRLAKIYGVNNKTMFLIIHNKTYVV